MLLHVHVQGGILFIRPKVVRILNVSLGVSSHGHIRAVVLRCRPVRPALSARLSEVTIVYINNFDASAVGIFPCHVNLILFFTANIISLTICSIRTRVWILMIILILLQKHHSFLSARNHNLPVVRSLRARVGLAISSHLHIIPLRQPVR